MAFSKVPLPLLLVLFLIGTLMGGVVIGNAQSSNTLFLPFTLTADQFRDGPALLVRTIELTGETLYWASPNGNLDYQITHNRTPKTAPVADPLGAMVVYQGRANEITGTLDFISSEGTPITSIPHSEFFLTYDQSSWSPNGDFFWYLGDYIGEEQYPLYTVNLTNSQTTTITTHLYRPSSWLQPLPSSVFWLPDGKLAYNEKTGSTIQPYLINADGTEGEPFNVSVENVVITNVLEDGRIVLGNGEGSYTVNADGSNLTYFPIGTAHLSPDGTRAASANQIVDLEGNPIVTLTYPPCGASAMWCQLSNQLLWSPDGKYVALTRTQYYGSGSYAYELFLTKTDGSQTEPTLVASHGSGPQNFTFSFSPDSRHLAYSSVVEAAMVLTYIHDLANNTQVEVAPTSLVIQGGWR